MSIEPQRALLEAIAGDRFEVRTLLPAGANPETFEPTIKTRKDIDDAMAYMAIGGMPFEDNIHHSLSSDVRYFDVSEGITPIYGTHDHGDGHDHDHDDMGADPHVWTSVKNARTMATNMLKALKDIDPSSTDYYTANYNVLIGKLDSLDRDFGRRLAQKSGTAFAVWHPSLSYFARDYGLRQISVGFENKEVSPAHMAHIAEEARQAGVRVLFFQREYDSRQAQSLARELSVNIITINPLDYDWQGQLENIVAALR